MTAHLSILNYFRFWILITSTSSRPSLDKAHDMNNQWLDFDAFIKTTFNDIKQQQQQHQQKQQHQRQHQR